MLHGSSVAPAPDPSPLLARLRAHAGRATDAVVTSGEGRGGDERLSYATLWANADAVAAVLRDGRASLAGAPIAFLIPPGPLFVEMLLAILAAGGVAAPLSPLHTQPELGYIISHAQPELVIASADLVPRAAAAATGRRVVDCAALLATAATTPKPAPADAGPAPRPDVHATAPAILLYTSGTTGRPKGVVLTHAAVAATLASLEEAWRWSADDRLLHALPLHHTHGLVVALLGALWAGATTCFLPFDAEAAWDQLADAALGVTVFMGVPTMYAKLIDAYRAAPADRRADWTTGAGRLRLFTSGSAALPAPQLRAFAEATGQIILERYGMTEIGMALSNRYDGARVAGAVGVPLPGVHVDIVGDDDRPVADGEAGELRVRSPQLFAGYLGDDDATAASYDVAGRFRTGDTGARDAHDGVIRLLGRTSVDVLKSGGYKISALEVEAVLRDHPAIGDVAVVGLPDPTLTWGDLITACVVARPGTAPLTLDALKDFARDRLAVYKLPRALCLLDALPRNAMGKVQKKALIAQLTAAGEPPA